MKEDPLEIYADVTQFNKTLDALVTIIYAKVKFYLFGLSLNFKEINCCCFSLVRNFTDNENC